MGGGSTSRIFWYGSDFFNHVGIVARIVVKVKRGVLGETPRRGGSERPRERAGARGIRNEP